MNKTLAHLISYLFHPCFLGTLLCLLLSEHNLTPVQGDFFWSFMGLIAIFTIVFPILFLVLFYRLGLVTSLHVERREERPILYGISLLFYGVTAYFLYSKGIAGIPVAYMMMHLTLLLGLVFILTFFYKVSAHAAGLGGLCGFWFALADFTMAESVLYGASLSFAFSGIVFSARLSLSAHSYAELVLGWLLGFGCLLTMFYGF